MKHGFIKVATVSPALCVADCAGNTDAILAKVKEAAEKGAKVIVFPELAITGATCGDLFLQDRLLADAVDQLERLREETVRVDALIIVGLPLELSGKVYNVAAVLHRGELLGLVPKLELSDRSELLERRQFTPGTEEIEWIDWDDEPVPFGANLIFECVTMEHLGIAVEIGTDLWSPYTPGLDHAAAGATLIASPQASAEMVGRAGYRRDLVKSRSADAVAAYAIASAGPGESTTDMVFGGHNLIAEDGKILAESKRFAEGILYSEIDVDRLCAERRKNSLFAAEASEAHLFVPFELRETETKLTRTFEARPFVPDDLSEREERCEEILSIQSAGLAKRMAHTHCERPILGVSGGLDSTLAMLVAARALDRLGLPRKNLLAVTMPCFGTTDRTYQNACQLTKALGATLLEVDIKEAVLQHFKDIKQDKKKHDATYENAQARERTQVLMDLANKENGLVVGTGDLSELALGWATYNGDHMSMYGVNGGVPKTLVRYLVRYFADSCGDKKLTKVLLDVLDTPVSPELLPPTRGKISQKTEELVGPYELHDFFLYYTVRYGFDPDKVFRLAKHVFAKGSAATKAAGIEGYSVAEIRKWLKVFTRRFFTQQFKRSCLPDGPKVGSVGISPRGDWQMPSDAKPW